MRLKKEDSLGVIYLLKRAELAARSQSEEIFAQFGLTPAQFLALFLLKRSRGISGAELAREIGVRPQSIVDLIRPLERQGNIVRHKDSTHRRILRMSLSPAGERLLGKALILARRLENDLLSSFTATQVSQLRESLTLLLDRVQHLKPKLTGKPASKPKPRRLRGD
jgi:DNA-binding MarR family transcriptional regulator